MHCNSTVLLIRSGHGYNMQPHTLLGHALIDSNGISIRATQASPGAGVHRINHAAHMLAFATIDGPGQLTRGELIIQGL